jgi:HEAT repeat protein
MREKSRLIAHITGGDPTSIIEAARESALRQESGVAPYLLEVLRSTSDASVRNAAALALSDLKDPSAFNVLVDLLKSERTHGSRGTILYALGAYDCSTILPLLVDMVIDGHFEVSRQAFSLISGVETEPRQSCLAELQRATAVGD